MYIRKLDGPRVVKLPDGSMMTRADLPSPQTRRWVASRKALVVKAVKYGLLSEPEALNRYGLSGEEYTSRANAVEAHGEAAMKAACIQKYRQS